MNVYFRFFISLSFLFLAGALAAEPLPLTASDGAPMDHFGSSVAASKNLLVVGAAGADVDGRQDQGAAYVFQRRGQSWVQLAKLVANDGHMEDGFGSDVAIAGNTIVVGAPNAWAEMVPARGAAYVFQRGRGGWQQTAKLIADDGQPNDLFGISVAVDGKTIAVGASNSIVDIGPPWGLDAGAVYVFEGKGKSWQRTARVLPEISDWMMRFGQSVDISGDTLIAGSPGLVDGTGGAYVFERDGTNWVQTKQFAQIGATRYPQHGHSVAIDGDRLALGGPWEDHWENWMLIAAGLISTSERTASGWSDRESRFSTEPAFNGHFAWDIDIHGDRAVVASPGTGTAHLYSLGAGWTESGSVSVPGVSTGPAHSVAISDRFVAFGWSEASVGGNAEQGAVYVEAL